MAKAKFRRVQGQSWRSAGVGKHGPITEMIVDALAADGMTVFGQVNADLMGSSRLEPTAHNRVCGQLLDDLDVCDRLLADSRNRRATTSAIAAIADKEGVNTLGGQLSGDDGQIPAQDRVRMKLPTQLSLCVHGASEDK
jgi:hypothetical protein